MDFGLTKVMISFLSVLTYLGVVVWLVSAAKSALLKVIATIAAFIGTALIIDLIGSM